MSGASANCSGIKWLPPPGSRRNGAGHDQSRRPSTPERLKDHADLYRFGPCSGSAKAFYAQPPGSGAVPLERQGEIILWSPMQLKPGEVRESQIKRHFQNAQIILLLLSADFYGDKKCTELCEQAIARSSKGAARVIPIVLRPCLDDPAVQNFIPLPKNGVPITTWENRGEAIAEVAKGIREVVQEMLAEQR